MYILSISLRSTMGTGSFLLLVFDPVRYDQFSFRHFMSSAGTNIGKLNIPLSYHLFVCGRYLLVLFFASGVSTNSSSSQRQSSGTLSFPNTAARKKGDMDPRAFEILLACFPKEAMALARVLFPWGDQLFTGRIRTRTRLMRWC